MTLLWLLACSTPAPTIEVQQRTLEEHVRFTGELAAKDVVVVRSRLPHWRVIAELAEDGKRVQTGDLLARLDVSQEEEELKNLLRRRTTQQTRIEQARARWAQGLAKADVATATAALDQRLAAIRTTEVEAVPEVQRVQSAIDAERADIDLRLAVRGKRRVGSEGEADLELLLKEDAVLETEIAALEQTIASSTTYATAPGVVVYRSPYNDQKIRLGDDTYEGVSFLEIPDVEHLVVVGWVHEVEGERLALGQSAMVTLDAHVATVVPATVSEVAFGVVGHGEHDLPQRRVVLELAELPEKMKPGMSVSVDLLVHHWVDAAALPVEVIFEDGAGSFVLEDATTQRPVTVQGVVDGWAVVSGVEPGQHVLASRPDAWGSQR